MGIMEIPTVTLNSGPAMPVVGYGTDLFGFALTAADMAGLDSIEQRPVQQDPATWEEC
jgi:hypothetical protein